MWIESVSPGIIKIKKVFYDKKKLLLISKAYSFKAVFQRQILTFPKQLNVIGSGD